MKKNSVINACLLAALVFCAWSLFFRDSSKLAYSDQDPGFNRAYWEQEFATRDAKDVYDEFKKRNAAGPLERQHVAAHPVGELIYAAEGINGIAVCDSSFGFGCYHGFFARAIGEGGADRIAELDAACVAAYGPLGTGCQHGIGHGILEYVGYDRVNDALALCGKTTESVPLLGCASGVFMEYHTPLASSGDGLVPSQRPVSEATTYEPCTTVPQKYQASCYYEIGEWVASAASGDEQVIKETCGGLSGAAREQCFLGVGGVLGFHAAYVVADARAMCAAVASGEDDVACNAGVSWRMYAAPDHRNKAEAACAYEDAATQARCLTLADLTHERDGI